MILQSNRPLIMGILNVTPDSFSDGGQYNKPNQAIDRAREILEQGADIIDIGGESTRPQADKVSVDEELNRVIPIVEAIQSRFDIAISVDTSKPEVMRAAINANVDMINDVRALQVSGALEACIDSDVSICLMHMQGQPKSMQKQPHYTDVITEVGDFFTRRIDACVKAGINRRRLVLDPGFGFGKTLQNNVDLLKNIDQFQVHGLPILVGLSRKTMIGSLLGDVAVTERAVGSASAAVVAVMKGAEIVRVHDVRITADALKIVKSVLN